jgi:hypothetical protein
MGMFSPRRLFSSRNYFSNWGGKIWIFRDTSQCVCFGRKVVQFWKLEERKRLWSFETWEETHFAWWIFDKIMIRYSVMIRTWNNMAYIAISITLGSGLKINLCLCLVE